MLLHLIAATGQYTAEQLELTPGSSVPTEPLRIPSCRRAVYWPSPKLTTLPRRHPTQYAAPSGRRPRRQPLPPDFRRRWTRRPACRTPWIRGGRWPSLPDSTRARARRRRYKASAAAPAARRQPNERDPRRPAAARGRAAFLLRDPPRPQSNRRPAARAVRISRGRVPFSGTRFPTDNSVNRDIPISARARIPLFRLKESEVDTIAQDRDFARVDAQCHQLVLERTGNGDYGCAPMRRTKDHSSRQSVARDQIDVRPSPRDDDGLPQSPPQPDGGDAIGIEVVSVNEVEVISRPDDPARGSDCRERERERRACHPKSREPQKPWMRDLDPVPYLMLRHSRIHRVSTKQPPTRRKPRHGRNHARFHFSACQQLAQPRLDEDAMGRAHAARVKC